MPFYGYGTPPWAAQNWRPSWMNQPATPPPVNYGMVMGQSGYRPPGQSPVGNTTGQPPTTPVPPTPGTPTVNTPPPPPPPGQNPQTPQVNVPPPPPPPPGTQPTPTPGIPSGLTPEQERMRQHAIQMDANRARWRSQLGEEHYWRLYNSGIDPATGLRRNAPPGTTGGWGQPATPPPPPPSTPDAGVPDTPFTPRSIFRR